MNTDLAEYFARQISIPEIGRGGLEKLQSSNVAVVGVGGVGSSATYYLAKSGVGHLTIIDQDIVEPANLQRIHTATQDDLYRPKAEVMSTRITNLSKGTSASPVVETLTERNVDQLLRDVSLIFDGLDNFRTRYILNRFALRSRTPYMFASALSNQAHLTLLNPPKTPCLDCILPQVKDRFQESCEALGVNPIITSVAGALGAAAVVQTLLGQSTRLLEQLLTIDLAGPEFFFNKTSKRKDCNSCASLGGGDSEASPFVTSLCGERTANILPPRDLELQLTHVSKMIPSERIIRSTDSVLVFRHGSRRVSLFPDGRLLMRDIDDEAQASEVAEEVWRMIRSG